MRVYLDKLLAALEKSYPEGLTVSELRERFSFEIDDTIHDAVRGRLIFYPNYHPGGNFLPQTKIYLDVKGLELLNQMKMKEAVDKLDVSINNFNKSSDKYSKKSIELTYAVYVFTILVVALPIYEKSIQLFNVSPVAEIVWLLIGIVVIAESMLIYYNKVWKKE